jgi:hypothetical protein
LKRSIGEGALLGHGTGLGLRIVQIEATRRQLHQQKLNKFIIGLKQQRSGTRIAEFAPAIPALCPDHGSPLILRARLQHPSHQPGPIGAARREPEGKDPLRGGCEGVGIAPEQHLQHRGLVAAPA